MYQRRRRNNYWLFALYGLIIGAAICVACFYERIPLILCPFRLLTGIPCPGCGGLRAAKALLHGEVLQALYINPLSCLVVLSLAVLPFLYLYDIIKGTDVVKRLLLQSWKTQTIIIVCVIIFLNWMWNIYKGI